jgi:hypothetical protein
MRGGCVVFTEGWLIKLQVLGKDDQVVAIPIKILYCGFERIASGKVEFTGGFIHRQSGGLKNKQAPTEVTNSLFAGSQKPTAHSAATGCGIHSNPVQVKGSGSESARAVASITQNSPGVFFDQEVITAAFGSLREEFLPKLVNTLDFFLVEDGGTSGYGVDLRAVFLSRGIEII